MAVYGKQLADGQLPDTEGDLYAVPAGKRAYVKSITCSNTSASSVTATLYVRPSASGVSRQVANVELEAGDTLYFDEPLTLEAGDKIRGQATTGAVVDYVISGGEEDV